MDSAVVTKREHRPIPLAEFVEREVQRRRWAVEGIWPEGASGVIAGPPKAGKSTISLELAVTLATATPFLARREFPARVQAARVTYIQAENSEQRVRRDLDAILEARGLGYMEEIPEEEGGGEYFRPTWPKATGDGDWEPDLLVYSPPLMDLMDPEDQEWLREHAAERDYIFLDPSYLLASANPNDTGEMMKLLGFLKVVRDESDCGVIISHQTTDKHNGGSAAARLIGSTFLHGWYESAIFTRRDKLGDFTLDCDNLREMGEQQKISVTGEGVGRWFYTPLAQGAEDAAGRDAPQVAGKKNRTEQFRVLYGEHGDDWTQEQYAEALGVHKSTVSRYRNAIKSGIHDGSI